MLEVALDPGRGSTVHLKNILISFFKASKGFAFLEFMRFMGIAMFIFKRQALSFNLVWLCRLPTLM